jgi:hypothetical protein
MSSGVYGYASVGDGNAGSFIDAGGADCLHTNRDSNLYANGI